jgi:hypothetical protein
MALGFSLLWFSSQSLYFGIASTGWPEAGATITYSTSKDTRRRRYVDIRYTYEVNGSEYSGDRWRYSVFMNLWQMRSIEVSAAQAAYPVGSHPRVAFDSRNPRRSVIEPGPHFDDLLWSAGGLMFAATGLLAGGTKRASPLTSNTTAADTARSGRHRYQFAGALACISFLLMSLGLYRIYAGIVASSWPIIEGRVLFSKTSSGNSAGNHQTEIRYEYVLRGRRYGGAASLLARHDQSFALSKAHPEGQAIEVHYDPANPERSVIETGITWHHFMLPLYAVVVLLLAALAKGVKNSNRDH